MKRAWLSMAVVVVAITVLQAGPSEKAAPWVDKMNGVMGKAHTCKYAADMNMVQMGQPMSMKMTGDMSQADEQHFRGAFSMDLTAPGMPDPMKIAMLIVADGTTIWMETENPMMGGKQVMKLGLEGLEELAKTNPQIKGMQDMNPSMQLKKMVNAFAVDLVGVSGGKVTLSAQMTPEAMADVLGPMAGAAPDAEKKMTLVLDEKTATPIEVRLGEPPMLAMRFTDFQFVDAGSLKDRFSYTPPEGVQVMDLKAMLGRCTDWWELTGIQRTGGWAEVVGPARTILPCLLVLVAGPTAGNDPGPSLPEVFLSHALQGNLKDAGALFDGRDEASLSEGERILQRRFRERFLAADEQFPGQPESPFIDALLAIYRDYWRRSLMQELPVAEGEAYLTGRLTQLLAAQDPAGAPPAENPVLERVLERLEAAGYHAINGITRPYFDLMIWTEQQEKVYVTRLTDTTERVRVVFVGGFLVKGWSHFATFGHASTGGWATPDALFCLREDYDLDSESFAVSYLKHESRHFADYERYPRLGQADLEYRAKLTELAFAETTLEELLQAFASNAGDNEAAPHALANHAVIRDLQERLPGAAGRPPWTSVKPGTIRRTARALLLEHTRKLLEAGASTTTGIL